MPVPFVQANTNGRLHPASEPSISPLNRGFLYGDAVYEVWRTYGSVVFAWEEHLARLQISAAALGMEIPLAPAAIFREVARTVAAFRAATGFQDEVYIRLQLSRGAGAIGLDTGLADQPDTTFLVQPCPAMSAEKMRDGLKLSLATQLRRNPIGALDPAWKTGNYLNNILCLREARARGADEVVMLNLAGEIAEAAVSNLAFVRDGAIVTPPLAAGILAGITRGLMLRQIAADAGVTAREEVLRPEALATMDECFLLSTTKDVQPVSAIDGVRFKLGSDSIAMRLKAAFAAYTRAYAASHPELKV